MSATTYTVYSNDLERERLRQAAYAMTPNRLSLNRHRIRRAGIRQSLIIAMVASENSDRTIEREARFQAGLEKGQRIDEIVNVVESRRPSRSQRRAFASNRMSRQEIFESVQELPTFPLTETAALVAADADRLV